MPLVLCCVCHIIRVTFITLPNFQSYQIFNPTSLCFSYFSSLRTKHLFEISSIRVHTNLLPQNFFLCGREGKVIWKMCQWCVKTKDTAPVNSLWSISNSILPIQVLGIGLGYTSVCANLVCKDKVTLYSLSGLRANKNTNIVSKQFGVPLFLVILEQKKSCSDSHCESLWIWLECDLMISTQTCNKNRKQEKIVRTETHY